MIYKTNSVFSWKLWHVLLQSCELAHRFRSSLCRVWPLPCFLILLPHPAVIVPNREKARFTIGDEGTLLGLNTSEPVSHRNRGAALQGMETEFMDSSRRNGNKSRVNGRGVWLYNNLEEEILSIKFYETKTTQRRKLTLGINNLYLSTCGESKQFVRIIESITVIRALCQIINIVLVQLLHEI